MKTKPPEIMLNCIMHDWSGGIFLIRHVCLRVTAELSWQGFV